MKHKWVLLLLSSTLLMSACSDNGQEENTQENHEDQMEEHMEDPEEDMDMEHGQDEHNHDREGSPAPENMIDAENPTYPVGSQALVTDDAHMEIMNGAIATISGAFDTTLYQVTFTPDGTDEPEEDHKWVVQEEIESEDNSYEIGDSVVLHADHMEGMEGQIAVITGKESGTAYMIDFEPTDSSEPFTNHKWVSEDELEPIDN